MNAMCSTDLVRRLETLTQLTNAKTLLHPGSNILNFSKVKANVFHKGEKKDVNFFLIELL